MVMMSRKSKRYIEDIITSSPSETVSLGERLSAQLDPGMTILLIGDLGAGKTTFVKGIARGLNIDPDEVISPTFVLLREHTGKIPLYHADAYRTEDSGELIEFGGAEYFNSDGIFVVEWGERWENLAPQDAIRIEIELLEGDRRKFKISSASPLNL